MTTQELVAEAAKVMDEEKPGWADNINFKTLKMHDSHNCVAGQNGLWYYGMNSLLRYKVGGNKDELLPPFGGSSQVIPFWKEEVKIRKTTVRLRDKVMLSLSACLPF